MFEDIPTKRPHCLFRMPGKKYFALKKCESKFVAIVFRHVGKSRSLIGRFGKIPRVIHHDIHLTHVTAFLATPNAVLFPRHIKLEGVRCWTDLVYGFLAEA